jgi:hypothetical protein
MAAVVEVLVRNVVDAFQIGARARVADGIGVTQHVVGALLGFRQRFAILDRPRTTDELGVERNVKRSHRFTPGKVASLREFNGSGDAAGAGFNPGLDFVGSPTYSVWAELDPFWEEVGALVTPNGHAGQSRQFGNLLLGKEFHRSTPRF